MHLIGLHGNGIHGTVLGAEGTADAVLCHPVLDQGLTFAGRAAPLDMGLVFRPEVMQGGEYGIGRGLAQAAETRLLDLMGQLIQGIQIAGLALALTESFQDVKHTPRADAAEGALAAGLILGEFQKVTGNVNVYGKAVKSFGDRAQYQVSTSPSSTVWRGFHCRSCS